MEVWPEMADDGVAYVGEACVRRSVRIELGHGIFFFF